MTSVVAPVDGAVVGPAGVPDPVFRDELLGGGTAVEPPADATEAVVLAPVATAISWQFLLSPQQGLINTVLRGVGLPAPNWLGDPHTALPMIVLVTAGKIVALNMLRKALGW